MSEVESKRCKGCKIEKSAAEFNKDRTRPDGLNSRCRPCHRKAVSESAKRHPETKRRNQRRWAAANREKVSAHWAVDQALKSGRLRKPSNCEECGTETADLHAHHEDHTKPLSVDWLCPPCHRARHGQEIQYAA